MQRFILILQFLTRITIAKDLSYDEDFKKGIIYFPLVGLVLGGILAVAYKGLSYGLNATVASILVIALYVALTGGLHLDGLGDTFDGFYSSRPRERILEIMKDSRLGTNGVIVIVFGLLIKIFGLAEVLPSRGLTALILMPVMGRLAIVYGSYNISYARKEGLGNIFIDKITKQEIAVATLLTVLCALLDKNALFFIPILWLFSYLFKKYSKQIIGGMTGDTSGALCELTEILYILYLLVLTNIKL
ncbi:adenosylcobinamide-GDP ribazoletransferase [Clostridium formicaceticum]|uniref:Adenosylcobinamide-GDP ribazoletransferase n=1 Tax=Clostridium formicaceticum TaxID=1497 RepID=A0AAC9RJ77_9CLOT|nr:adenosylcobinamide-GDP ribazoletransferase [Clostridium formicaceticum]AOY76346.1 cobalamin 5'-phosphate synthase [Clostridium formicaceticum]ARE86737.1 Cobalamin synthase [Clostridium formicaceticum]